MPAPQPCTMSPADDLPMDLAHSTHRPVSDASPSATYTVSCWWLTHGLGPLHTPPSVRCQPLSHLHSLLLMTYPWTWPTPYTAQCQMPAPQPHTQSPVDHLPIDLAYSTHCPVSDASPSATYTVSCWSLTHGLGPLHTPPSVRCQPLSHVHSLLLITYP